MLLEFKAASEMHPVLKLKNLNHIPLKSPKGVLINFNCYNIFKEEGQKTLLMNL
jgi:hypothetical protein